MDFFSSHGFPHWWFLDNPSRMEDLGVSPWQNGNLQSWGIATWDEENFTWSKLSGCSWCRRECTCPAIQFASEFGDLRMATRTVFGTKNWELGPWWSSDKAWWPPFSRNLRGASCHSDWKGETQFQLQSLVALHLMFLAKSCIYQNLRATNWLDVVPFHLNEDLRDKLRRV